MTQLGARLRLYLAVAAVRMLPAGVAGAAGAGGVPRARAPCMGVVGRPAQVSRPLREPQAGTQQVTQENHLGLCLSPNSTQNSGPPCQCPHGHLLTCFRVSTRCPGVGEDPPVRVPTSRAWQRLQLTGPARNPRSYDPHSPHPHPRLFSLLCVPLLSFRLNS